MDGLAKPQLDLEAIAVERENLQRLKGEIGAEQKDRAAGGVMLDHVGDGANVHMFRRLENAVGSTRSTYPESA